MSWEAQKRVWEDSQQRDKVPFLVLLRLATCANEHTGHAYEGVTTLARLCRTDRRTVQRALATLEKAGEISMVSPPGKLYPSATYRVTVGAKAEGGGLSPQGAQPSAGSEHEGGGLSADRGRADTARSKEEALEEATTPLEAPHEEDDDFTAWLAHHEAVTGTSPPRSGTAALKKVRGAYGARRKEGYPAADLRVAVNGAYNDPYRREHGHYGHISVLRPEKVHDLIEKGRRGAGGPVAGASTMADREQAARSLKVGAEERTRHSQIISQVRTIMFPPSPGEMDPFTMAPVETAADAEAVLRGMGLDPEAAVAEHRDEADKLHGRITRRGIKAAA